MKEYYSLPLLFEKFHLAKGVVRLMNEHPYIFRDNIVIESFYGSNGGKLCGGRNSVQSKYSEKEVARFVESNGITPVVVMSNLLIDDDDIPDEYAVKITEAFEHKKMMFCVANRNVEDWLENVCYYNRGQFILSTTPCLDVQQTKDETDRYKKIVLSEKYINDWSTLQTFSERTRSKLEIVVNMSCPNGCEMRRKHYENISGLALGRDGFIEKFPCCNEKYGGYGQLHEILKLPGVVTLDKIGTYLNMGINHFKIEGRSNYDYVLIETMSYFLVKPEYQLMFRDTLNHLNC